ncbi:MAG: hypothetical protein Q7S37_01790 [bacterium]|nr:hypothetical protein [bacterium]
MAKKIVNRAIVTVIVFLLTLVLPVIQTRPKKMTVQPVPTEVGTIFVRTK